jgi:hypothetical protein
MKNIIFVINRLYVKSLISPLPQKRRNVTWLLLITVEFLHYESQFTVNIYLIQISTSSMSFLLCHGAQATEKYRHLSRIC